MKEGAAVEVCLIDEVWGRFSKEVKEMLQWCRWAREIGKPFLVQHVEKGLITFVCCPGVGAMEYHFKQELAVSFKGGYQVKWRVSKMVTQENNRRGWVCLDSPPVVAQLPGRKKPRVGDTRRLSCNRTPAPSGCMVWVGNVGAAPFVSPEVVAW